MKKWLLILLIVGGIQTSYSQTEKGKMFIGGQVSLSGNSNSSLDNLDKSDYSSFRFTIAPDFGYFLSDNFAIGTNINLGVSNSTQNNENTSATAILPSKYTYKSKSLIYGLGGFARYYLNITDNFKFYLNSGINYLNSTGRRTVSNNDPNYVYSPSNPASQENQTNSISLNVYPGLVYFLTPKIGVQTSFGNLNYTFLRFKNKSLPYDSHSNSSEYSINLNPSTFNLGLNYYF